MDNPNYTIEHRKGQHLTTEERHDIEVHLRDKWSSYKIAKHLGLISLKNIDLPEKLSRNTKQKKVLENKKNLGDSIDLRDEHIENRDDFGNREIDSVPGKKAAEELFERELDRIYAA